RHWRAVSGFDRRRILHGGRELRVRHEDHNRDGDGQENEDRPRDEADSERIDFERRRDDHDDEADEDAEEHALDGRHDARPAATKDELVDGERDQQAGEDEYPRDAELDRWDLERSLLE